VFVVASLWETILLQFVMSAGIRRIMNKNGYARLKRQNKKLCMQIKTQNDYIDTLLASIERNKKPECQHEFNMPIPGGIIKSMTCVKCNTIVYVGNATAS